MNPPSQTKSFRICQVRAKLQEFAAQFRCLFSSFVPVGALEVTQKGDQKEVHSYVSIMTFSTFFSLFLSFLFLGGADYFQCDRA